MAEIITAEDMAKRDPYDGYAFCCPLVGAYPCEQLRRGCYCHELHLKNEHDREQRVKQWWRDAAAELRESRCSSSQDKQR